MRRVMALAGVALLALTAVACDREGGTNPGLQSIEISAADYSFGGDDEVGAGIVEMTLSNDGKEVHHLGVLELNPGRTADDVRAAAKSTDNLEATLAGLGRFAGGPNAADPGGSEVATMDLAPGKYAFYCAIPNAEGKAHATLGMVADLEVTGDAVDVALPEADYASAAIESTDPADTTPLDFTLPAKWDGPISFENKGAQVHEIAILGIAEGKTAQDFLAAFGPDAPPGPPPYTGAGGLVNIAPGRTANFEVDLEPGTYFAMCFVGDPVRMAPHFALGMLKQFEVK